jgi:xanthine dehydrogenase YagT iron-sulfur-binding subunit
MENRLPLRGLVPAPTVPAPAHPGVVPLPLLHSPVFTRRRMLLDVRTSEIPSTGIGPEPATIVLTVNGADHQVSVDPRSTLLDTLRERIGLFGTKKGCDRGECGACTVMIDGRRVNACLTLAVMQAGHTITTIEGLADGDDLHPVQAAFIEYDAFQCGYCTPGQIISAVALLQEGHASSETEIGEWMSGNVCRCGAYPNIVAAIRSVADASATR